MIETQANSLAVDDEPTNLKVLNQVLKGYSLYLQNQGLKL